MAVEIFYRYNSLDKEHEYGIVIPFKSDTENYSYWTYWLWYYLGMLTNGIRHNPTIIPFANTWDEDCKLIKIYKTFSHANKTAIRVNNFIQKHYSKHKSK